MPPAVIIKPHYFCKGKLMREYKPQMCYHPDSNDHGLNEFLWVNISMWRQWTCWGSILGLMKQLRWRTGPGTSAHTAWSESERESDKEKWAGVRQRLSDCGCELMKSGFWLVGVNQSAFKCIFREAQNLKSSAAPSPTFVPKPPIPSPIWRGCCFEFWWKKTWNLLLPEFPLYTTSSPLLSPFIVTCL